MPVIQPIHLILILVIALIIFGPSRLPQLGKSLGESITEFKHASKEMTDSLKEATDTKVEPSQSTVQAPVTSVPGAQASGGEVKNG